ncbi:MAG: SDR family NAD(P)-dependent oxidoreductase, partial [Dehalococcoidales bacterium]|nr:SDR family NAD(P)-dependent oxidoreductase [Dehalococcoidales bacterium]
MSPVLKDKVAIITGAGRGIGKAFALRFAEEGARIFIPDISLERAEETVKEIKAKGGEAAAILTDVSDEKATQAMAEKVVQLYGKADILVNNAAIWYGLNITPWDQWKPEDWDRIFSVNVKGSWLCCKAVVPLMVKQKSGKIINIASNVARVPAAQVFLPYACSKGAVYTLTQALARALGGSGINVNAIAPGYTASEASLTQRDNEATF